MAVNVGVQFRGSIDPGATQRWFTFRWPQQWHVVWNVVPTSPRVGAPQVDWDVEVERADANYLTHWITVKNISPARFDFEGRYIIMNA